MTHSNGIDSLRLCYTLVEDNTLVLLVLTEFRAGLLLGDFIACARPHVDDLLGELRAVYTHSLTRFG